MISINFHNTLTETVGKNGLDYDLIKNYNFSHELDTILTKSKDMLGWLDLPNTPKKILEDIEANAEYVRDNFDNFVVLGIGGSALGTKMLYSALPKDDIACYVCDNIDPDSFVSLLSKLNIKKTFFNVITKSGGTSETIASMKVAVELLRMKNVDISKNLLVTTEVGNALYNFAKENGIRTLIVPRDVGGRFSVLSPVGLFPAAVSGIDIRKLLSGAKKCLKNGQNKNTFENLSALFAVIAYEQMKNGKDEIVLMPYSDRLSLVPDFFCQIWAESLGKKKTLDNKNVKYFQTPIKAVGATDQHSLIQLFVEGANTKLFTLLKVEKFDYDLKIPNANVNLQKNLDNVALGKLINFEMESTAYALAIAEKPSITISMDKISEENMGELIFLFELATALCGEFLNINTYNQPGVENGKIYTKALLDKKENEKKTEILNHIEKAKQNKITLK